MPLLPPAFPHARSPDLDRRARPPLPPLRPGLMRRKQNPHQANQELVDVIWLPLDTASFPDAVKRMLPQASADW